MIYTSYFAIAKRFPTECLVSISLKSPSYFKRTCKALAPTWDILSDYKRGLIGEEEYERRYKREVLSQYDPKRVAEILDGKILLCYESPGKFCHRHIVAEWLKEAGCQVKEISQLQEMEERG